MNRSALLLTALLTFAGLRASAHGVVTDVKLRAPSVIVTSLFSENQPVTGAVVTIWSPTVPDALWQSGKTDMSGRFAFVPDKEGDWVFLVDDQKGHAKKLTITVPAAFLAGIRPVSEAVSDEKPTPAAFSNMALKTITGLSLIFGLTGLFYGFRSRQASGERRETR